MRKGDFEKAIIDYDRAIQLEHNHTNVYYNRGIAYKNKGDLNKAIADYDIRDCFFKN